MKIVECDIDAACGSIGAMRLSNWTCPCLCACVFAVGCGDFAGATGDQGLLRFTLVTDFELPSNDLRDLTIVAGHQQRLDVDLTQDGAASIDAPEDLTYTIDAAGNVAEQFGSEDDPPDALITITDPGTVRLEAIDATGAFVDGLDLEFDESTALELDVRVRAPWEDELDKQDEGVVSSVVEGSQATFLPIPLDESGERLAGDLEATAAVDPEWAVVPGASVGGVYENGYWTLKGEIEFYFIEPGDVTVTVTDAVSGAEGTHDFSVDPVQKP